MSKNFRYIFLLIVMLVAFIHFSEDINANEEKQVYVYDGRNMCKSGKYIYYIRPQSKKNPGIVRYNPKTGKKKLIIPNELNGEKTGRFDYNLEVKGKYIYCVWDIADPKDADNIFGCKAIYRFSKNGKKKELLAYGENMVIIGKRIYYDKLKIIKINGFFYTEEYEKQKRYSMKLDGSDKKKVKVNYKNQSNRSMEMIYPEQVTFPIEYDKYTYYVENYDVDKTKKLCRVSGKTGKSKVLMKFNKNCTISSFCISENYLSVCVSNYEKEKSYVYLSKINGKNVKRLEKWSY